MPFKSKELDPLRQMAEAAILRQQQLERAELEAIYDWYAISCPCGLPPGDCEKHPRARQKQRPPDRPEGHFQPPDEHWRIWIMCAGRGGGKTAAGSHFINEQVEKHGVTEIVIVNATAGDVRDVNVLGRSGIVDTSPPWCKAVFIPSRAQVEWRRDNGQGELVARAYLRASEVPDSLRGLNASLVWADEPSKWIYQEETWLQIRFILRNKVTPPPRCVVTGTPTASDLFYHLEDRAETPYETKTFMVQWHTRENEKHLDAQSIAEMEESLEHTLLGQQELGGVIIRRKEGALWGPRDFETKGFRLIEVPELDYIGIGVDPQVGAPKHPATRVAPKGKPGSKKPKGAETGIVVGGRLPRRPGSYVSRGVVLDDRTLSGTPGEWGKAVVRAYYDWEANEVVAEKNQGGEMVRHVIETVPAEGGYPSGRNVPIRLVYASQGKTARAEPIQALYEAHRVHHYTGPRTQGLDALERQMVQYMPGKSGQLLDRVDALVWILYRAIIEHDGGGQDGPVASGLSRKKFQQLAYDRPW